MSGRGSAVAEQLASSFVGRCIRSLMDMQGVDRAMVIASQAFTALVPLLIVVSTAAPAGREDLVADALVRRFELTEASADAVRQVFSTAGAGSTDVFGIVLLVISGVTLTRRMQRMYLVCWGVEPQKGVRGSLDATLGLSVLLLEIALLASVRSLVGALPYDWVIGTPAAFLLSTALWTTVPWLLLDRRLAWRRLLLGGLLTAACANVYAWLTTLYMPGLMERYSLQYGLFGVTLALVGWLLSIALIIVVTTVVAAEIDRSDEPWLRRLRTAVTGRRPAATT